MMKKITILMLTLLCSSNVLAVWSNIGKGGAVGDAQEFTAYVDLETIKKNDNKVKIWRLFDYNNPQTAPDGNTQYWSARYIDEYDCTDITTERLSFSLLSEKMGGGVDVFSSSKKIAPKEIPPNTISKTIFNIACGTK